MKRLILAFLCLFSAIPCQARIITVDDDGPADFNNIQAAIDDANDDDTVIVQPGWYTGAGNYDIDFGGKAITVRSTDPNDPNIVWWTLIHCDGHRGFHFHSGETANSVVDGLTIVGGHAWNGAAIFCDQSSPTISNCYLTVNWADSSGGAISCWRSNSVITGCTIVDNVAHSGGGIDCRPGTPNMTISNCIIANNRAVGSEELGPNRGGGICLTGDNFTGPVRIINCTFSGNEAMYGGAIFCEESAWSTLVNCILWDDSAANGPEIAMTSMDWGSCLSISFSDVQGGEAGIYDKSSLDWGPGNIDTDPCFAGGCHLKSTAGRWDRNSENWVIDANTSLCIDAGNPGCPPDSEPMPNGNRINMGAYGGTTQASKSPADWALLADFTNDHKVDSNDLRVFVNYWLENGHCIPSDLSRDQSVDFVDFAIFALQQSETSPAEPGMTYQIGDCDWLAASSDSNETRFSVWVEGRYIHFEDLMYANCCPDELVLEMTVQDNLITIFEIEYTSSPCRCICNFPVTATLGPFEPGTYTLEVYEDYGGFIGSTTVTISPDQ